MAAHEHPYIRSRVWWPLQALSIDEQNGYFETVMLKVLAQAKGSEHRAFDYLTKRYVDNVTCHKAPQDAPQIHKLLDEALACLAATNPPLRQEILAEMSKYTSLSQLFEPPDQTGTGLPVIPGSVLLYDSGIEEARARNNFAGLVEGGVLWLARIRPRDLDITRTQISNGATETCVFPIDGTANPNFEQLSLSRSPTHLFVADRYRVFALPVAPQAPFLDPFRYETAGPTFGADETTSAFANEMRALSDPHYRRVTAAIAAGDAVYIGLDQRTLDNRNRYGALYRWRPGTGEPELICASDSLKPGPLNDCLPYSIVGGCAAPGGEDVYFVLEKTPDQPTAESDGQRCGIWKLTPSTGAWKQVSDASLGTPRERPWLRTPALLDIPGIDSTHEQFDLGTRQVRPAAGLVSGADPSHGWSCALEIESGVRYERLYRVEGKHSTRMLSLLQREFSFNELLPSENGFIVLIYGPQPAGNKPTTRSLVYLLPQEK